MRLRFFPVIGRLVLLLAAFPALAQSDSHGDATPLTDANIDPDNVTNVTDANIAQVTAEMLQSWHYSRHPFDAEISSKFLDRYLDSLDYYHLYFLQSDIDQFNSCRSNLNVMILRHRDLTPCWTIFDRFMERAHQRVSFVTNYLDTAKMDFTGHDRFTPDRHLLPYPKDAAQEQEDWRQVARCEYLEELLKAPKIKYEGKVKSEPNGNTDVELERDKAHPLKFDYLPQKFYAKDGRQVGWVEVAGNHSNAIAHLDWAVDQHKHATNTIYSASGEELGNITTHFLATLLTNGEPDSSVVTNVEEASVHHSYATNLAVRIELDQKNLADVLKTITNHYVQMLKNYKQLNNDRVFEIYMNSLAHAYDPHTDYMGHMTAENFAIQMKLSLFGIGALLGEEDGYCKIESLKDGPAMRSGKIKPNDRIVAVAESNAEPVNVVGMPLDQVVQMIRGPKGTKVTLTILPAAASDSSARKLVTLIRDEIKLEDAAAKAQLFELNSPSGQPERLGLIELPSFYADPNAAADSAGSKTTSSDVARLITRLKKEHVDGIILDLRGNGGGYLEEAIRLTGLFIRKGPVVQTKDFNGDTMIDSDPDPSVLWDGPLIVLTSRYSASASEILVGALQDYGRALIVGDTTTFGKGTVQTPQALAPILESQHMRMAFDPGELKVTIKKFYRAGGASTQLKGVLSDIVLPSVLNYAEVGESFLPNAMPWDEVSSADFDYLDRVKPYLPELKERSHRRVQADPEFQFIEKQIARYKKEMADKSVSLNEKERLAEQKQIIAEADALKRERAEHKAAPEKEFEITLKNVDMASLFPPPSPKTNNAALNLQGDEDEFDVDEASAGQDETAAVDPTLEETKRIMMDYISLLNNKSAITKADAAPAPAVGDNPPRPNNN